jgi:hypothetical protein
MTSRTARLGTLTPRAARLLAVLASALLVAGCGGLTTEGPVEPGLEVGAEEGQSSNLRYVFPGPRDGDEPVDIVSGFLRAGAASDGVYDNAQAFLTVSAAEAWNPDATLVLLADDTPPTATLVDPTHVRVTATPEGTVDQSGRYTPAAPGEKVSAEFTLTDAADEWRISELPERFGRWIQRGDVTRLVQPYQLTYISTSQRATVPDVRWFPLDKLATRLARAQLDPVPKYLQGAVSTAVPEGARLLGDAVSLDDNGLATVNLVGPRLGPEESVRQDLWAQFITTLNQDLSVNRVALSVNGTPVDLLGLDGSASSLADIGFPPRPTPGTVRPVVRRGGDVTVFDPTGASPSGPGYPTVPQEYTDLALSADGAELAAVDPGGGGVSRWRDDTRYEVPGFGSQVGAPSFDRRGWLWLGGVGDGDDRLFVVPTAADPADPETSSPTPVRADWLANRRVVEATVAAGGDRVAVLSTRLDGSNPRIDLSGVVRGSGGRPERLADPLLLSTTVKDARGLTWVDSLEVASIVRRGSRAWNPAVIGVDRTIRELPPAEGAVSIASTGGERDIFLVTDEGRLLTRSSSGWTDSGRADDIAVAAG